jgi:hypothetical protein
VLGQLIAKSHDIRVTHCPQETARELPQIPYIQYINAYFEIKAIQNIPSDFAYLLSLTGSLSASESSPIVHRHSLALDGTILELSRLRLARVDTYKSDHPYHSNRVNPILCGLPGERQLQFNSLTGATHPNSSDNVCPVIANFTRH